MDPYSILADAISSKQQVVARYHDEERIFSPHALGTKRGVAHVLVYQYAGGSHTGLPPGGEWRCLNVEELSEIRLEPGAWRTAENVFNPRRASMRSRSSPIRSRRESRRAHPDNSAPLAAARVSVRSSGRRRRARSRRSAASPGPPEARQSGTNAGPTALLKHPQSP
jgi:hypothetical protein